MLRILLIEDDEFIKKAWEFNLRFLYKDVKLECIQSVDQMKLDGDELRELDQNFDVIVSDIFLSGDKTGVDFLHKLSKSLLRKTVISSSIDEDEFYGLCVENKVSCLFIKKPINRNKIKVILDQIISANGLTESLDEVSSKARLMKEDEVGSSGLESRKLTVLITGCSSGIGQALALKLVNHPDYNIVITARDQSLASVKKEFESFSNTLILPLDLTKPDQIKSTVLEVLRKWGRIDILINNAGVCYRTVVEHMDLDSELNQLRTNYLGPMTLIRSVIPVMRERGFGKIINVSSVSGIMGMPTMGSYSASKHALEGASESLWHELMGLGIKVTVVRPGFINSDGYTHVTSTQKALLATKLSGPWAFLYQFMDPFVRRLMQFSRETPDRVADRIINHVMRKKNPPLWYNVTNDAFIFALLKQFIPSFLFHRFINLCLTLNLKLANFFSSMATRFSRGSAMPSQGDHGNVVRLRASESSSPSGETGGARSDGYGQKKAG